MDIMIHEFSTRIYNFNKILIFARGRGRTYCLMAGTPAFHAPQTLRGCLGSLYALISECGAYCSTTFFYLSPLSPLTLMKMYIYTPKLKFGNLGVYFFTSFPMPLFYF